jgi:hypothetical protein
MPATPSRPTIATSTEWPLRVTATSDTIPESTK